MNNKEKLQAEIISLKKHRKVFYILGFSFLGLSIALAITSIIISLTIKDSDLFMYFAYFASVSMSASVTMFILGITLFSFRINRRIYLLDQGIYETNMMVNKEDVIVKSKEEELLDQYANLLKQGYITQEDFDKKKEELTPKKNA